MGSTPVESNFWFLRGHDPVLLTLASMAEQVFAADPNTTLIKLRQLGGAFAKDLAGRAGLQVDERSSQADLIFQLSRELRLDPRIRELFHVLRVEGNKATHGFATQHREAMDGLKVARELAVWYHRAFGRDRADFKPGPFSPPRDPAAPLREVQAEVKQLQAQLDEARKAHAESMQLAKLQQEESELHAALAEAMDVEAREQASLVAERERELAQLREEFDQRIARMSQAPDSQGEDSGKVQAATHRASQAFDLSEDLTRILIDQQLLDAGWEADSVELTHASGTRPEKGVNRAIAEWPTQVAGAKADYVLFSGLVPVAIVEAKRKRINVADRITQAERYARDLVPSGELHPAWRRAGLAGPWPDGEEGNFHVPLAFSCNGRPYIKQLAEQSGIWFRDLRRSSNLRRALQGFHTPDGISDLLKRDIDGAQSRLAEEGMAYLRLRDYQQRAIQAVEDAMAAGDRTSLLAMATGTGKTRTIIGLIYRLLKTERFRRILFLVDRSALGEQAQDAMGEMRLEQNQTLSQIYNLDGLQDTSTADEARVQVATVQAMVRRIFQSDAPPPIDTFDCIVVDEAHRGYTLDQEMTEGELATRDHAQYMSQYRRVLDYFDAHRIGLTATPAKHTTDIFGKPVYTYSYREAVADDWLIDHEPPIRYETLLSSRVAPGDILLSIVGSIGRAAIVREGRPANIARAVARLSADRSRISPEWLFLWLTSPRVQWWLLSSSKEVARKTLNLKELSELPVPVPPKDVQDAIVRRAEQIFTLTDHLETKVSAAQKRIDALTPSLLAKAFRGELVPQDPNDEPASVLLERIRAQRAAAPKPKRDRKAAAN